jgi:hypothetical protein
MVSSLTARKAGTRCCFNYAYHSIHLKRASSSRRFAFSFPRPSLYFCGFLNAFEASQFLPCLGGSLTPSAYFTVTLSPPLWVSWPWTPCCDSGVIDPCRRVFWHYCMHLCLDAKKCQYLPKYRVEVEGMLSFGLCQRVEKGRRLRVFSRSTRDVVLFVATV